MGETRDRGVKATEGGSQRLRDAKAARRNLDGRVWTYRDVAINAGVDEKTVRRFFKQERPVDESSARSICQALNLDIEEVVALVPFASTKDINGQTRTSFFGDLGSEPEHSNAHLNNKQYQNSPFIAGPPITQPRHFFGRQRELKRLFKALQSFPLQYAAIIGHRRAGKTSLLNYLQSITTTAIEELRPGQKSNWLLYPKLYQWIYVDFQDRHIMNRTGLLTHILNSMKLPTPSFFDLDYFVELVGKNLKMPTVILMDGIDIGLHQCPELDNAFWDSLRSLTLNKAGGNLTFVVASPIHPLELAQRKELNSPFFNMFCNIVQLEALTEVEARELIATSPIPFNNNDVEWILHESGCWPILLQILCRECLFSLEEGIESWKEEALEQIVQFRFLLEKP